MANNKDFKIKNDIKPTVYYEDLGSFLSGTEPYGFGSLSDWSYDSKSFDVSSEETAPAGIAFKPDGTKMFIIGFSGDAVLSYTLSTAWDVSTASYDSVSFSVSSQETTPYGMFFKPDGTKMYIVGNTSDTVYQYSLSTAWDISTLSYESKSVSVAVRDSFPTDVAFKPDGTQMFVLGDAGYNIIEYTLSTAWDVSTATFVAEGPSMSSQNIDPRGIYFESDGYCVYVVGSNPDRVSKFTLSTAWDVSTLTHDSDFSLSSQDTTTQGFTFKPDGTKMYVLGSTNDTVFQYSTTSDLVTKDLDLSTGAVFEITPTSDMKVGVSNPVDSGTVSQATLLLGGGVTTSYDLSAGVYDNVSYSISSQSLGARDLFFKSDGTKMYILDDTEVIYQYSLSTAYDITTASYDSVSFSVSTQDTEARGMFIGDSGTKLYLVGGVGDAVYQYTLSTAWDLSTASYANKSFLATSQDTVPWSAFFKPDGTKMFLVGRSNVVVYQYTLSTAWDVSTTSYDSVSFAINLYQNSPFGIEFSADGKKFFASNFGGYIYQYNLSTAYDLSTASYNNVFLDASSQGNNNYGIRFNDTGYKLFNVENVNDLVYQYTTAKSAVITYDTPIEFAGGTAPTGPALGETDVLTFSTRDGGTTYQATKVIDGAY